MPDDHLVRRIAAVLDLTWVYDELAPILPHLGRPSIDPVLMVRMLVVGYVFAIRSERALCREVQVNLAYRWFCGLEIAGQATRPFGVLSGPQRTFPRKRHLPPVFERVVGACIAAGLVGGEGFAVDASLTRPMPTSIVRSPVVNGTGIFFRSRRAGLSGSISRRSTIRPTARQVTSRRSSSRRPILPRNGPARCAMRRSSPTPTTI